MDLMYLELLLRKHNRHNGTPGAVLALIVAVVLFEILAKKFAPNMNDKVKKGILVVIVLAVVALSALFGW